MVVETTPGDGVATLPRRRETRFRQRLAAARRFDIGPEKLRDVGGPVTRNVLAPRWIMPPLLFFSSPQGAHDVLGRNDAFGERGVTPVSWELRRLMGDNLLVVPYKE
jgi:hypothetical protein